MVVTGEIFKRKQKLNITYGRTSWDSRAGKRARKLNRQLLPGIPDDITITIIMPRLPWAMLQRFTVVSRGWLHALREEKIFEARVFANSTKTFFVYCVHETNTLRFALYSVEDGSVYSVPKIPGLTLSTLKSFTYTSVNGRLYVFGRMESETIAKKGRWPKVFAYEYDLARYRGWRKCATPKHVRAPNECAVMNNKIFVCDFILTSALYDPVTDIWSPIRISPFDLWSGSPIIRHVDGPHQKVIAGAGLPEDLIYQYGAISKEMFITPWITNFKVHAVTRVPFFSFPCGAHIESMEQEVKTGKGIAVTLLNGRFLKLTEQHIDAYDSHTNTWTPLDFGGPCEFIDRDLTVDGFRPSKILVLDVAVVRTKNEIYSVMLHCRSNQPILMKCDIMCQGEERQEYPSNQQIFCLGQWKQLEYNLPDPLSKGFLRCPIQL